METGGRVRRHGRTRAAILREALAMMGEGGAEAVVLRELARRLDYSPAGLYRYFAGREEIISTLAGESMGLLAEHLRTALTAGAPDPMVAVGLGYLAFAREQPVRFRLLFTELPSARRSLGAPADAASPYAIVVEAARAAIGRRLIGPDLDAESVAYTLWALVHGMAVLEATHLRGFDADFDRADELALQRLVHGWRPSDRAGGHR